MTGSAITDIEKKHDKMDVMAASLTFAFITNLFESEYPRKNYYPAISPELSTVLNSMKARKANGLRRFSGINGRRRHYDNSV